MSQSIHTIKNQKNQKNARVSGFSLIELLIAVAIIAILGAIAQPIYSDYVVRAKMSEPQQIADNLGTRITQCLTIDSGSYSECNSFDNLNISAVDYQSDVVESVTIDSSTPGFTIELQNTGNDELDAANLEYSNENSSALIIRWQCEISDATLNHLVSRQCRG